MTEQELKEIEQRAEKATKGPWSNHDSGHFGPTIHKEIKSDPEKKTICKLTFGTEYDREFIAAARTDIPALVAEVRRFRSALEFYAKRTFLAATTSANQKLVSVWAEEEDYGKRARDALGPK